MMRMRSFARLLAAAWLVLVAAACSKGPELPKLGPDDVVLAFGDSLTYGTGAAPEQSYPAVLGTLIGRKVVAEGVPGETTVDGVQRLPEVLDRHRPRILLLCMGGNDMLRKLDSARTVANLRDMIAAARSRGVAVVMLGVPRPALFGGAASFYVDLADELGLPYEGDVINAVLRDANLKSDPIHPNAQGYRRIAEAVADLLRRHGAL